MGMLRVILGTVTFVVPVTAAFCDVVGYIAKVEGTSMQPVLNPDEKSSTDWVFLSRWAARSFEFKRGEVVSFKYGNSKNAQYKINIVYPRYFYCAGFCFAILLHFVTVEASFYVGSF